MKRKLVAATLAVSMVVSVAGSWSAQADSKGDELEGKIEDVQNQQMEKQNKLQEEQENLEKVQDKQQQTIRKIEQIDSDIDKVKGQMDTKQAEISKTKTEIDKLEERISETQKRIERRNELLKERVRVMYQNGGAINYLQVLLGAQSFSDFLDRVFALKLIAQQDQALLKQQRVDKKALESDKAEVQLQLAKLEDQLEGLQTLKTQFQERKEEKKALVEKLNIKEGNIKQEFMETKEAKELLEAQEATYKKLLAEWKEKQRRIRERKEREAAERRKQEQKQNDSNNDNVNQNHDVSHSSGAFAWPANGVITSNFGYRSFDHEVHRGLDIAANGLVPIRASAPGIVIRSAHWPSFGNVVYIAHLIDGKLYTTVYAHMRRRLVSSGQRVEQRQKIGYMGSTGDSTGQHLHFEIHIGKYSHASAVPPLNYLP